jgi:hypothetical protein
MFIFPLKDKKNITCELKKCVMLWKMFTFALRKQT